MNINENTIRVLVFGDSNTWGQIPGKNKAERYNENQRWTGILQKLLGNKYEIIEEGLNGRSTNIDSPNKDGKNGAEYLYPCIESQSPIDIVILALGKNDLKAKYNRTPEDIAGGIKECIEIINKEGRNKTGKTPQILLVSPGIIEEVERIRFGKVEIDFLGGKNKSKVLPMLYKEISEIYKINFLDLSDKVKASRLDGVHLEAEEHRKMAEILYPLITSF